MQDAVFRIDRRAIFRADLPYQSQWRSNRILIRAVLSASLPLIGEVHGAQRLLTAPDPFILAVNHTQYAEALLIPTLLMFLRGGKPIRFLADWNFLLIPGICSLLRRAETIPVTGKPARPHWLNRFKSALVRGPCNIEGARMSLANGRSIGIFPEGKAHGDTQWVRSGRRGAAVLALESGVPVFPAGIRFPGHIPGRPLPALAPMELHIGKPLNPGRPLKAPNIEHVRDFHRKVMTEIAALAGKTWIGALTGE